MAPAFSKLKVTVLSASLSFTVIGVLCLGYFVYRLFEGSDNSEEANEIEDKEEDGENRFQKLIDSLDSMDDETLLHCLCSLGNLTAFREFQVLVREHGALAKITNLLQSSSLDIKGQALNVINNLTMDIENQAILKDFIPEFVGLLHHPSVSVKIQLAVTRVLTNLTTLDENHDLLLPHCVYLFALLKSSDHMLKLQVLKILVNLSTNQKNVESLLEIDLQIINAIAEFVDYSMDEDLLLRAVTCLANILTTLHQKWHNGDKILVSTAEFVPANMESRLEELSQHLNEDIRLKSQKALSALKEPVSTQTVHAVKDIDLVEILRL